MAESYLCKAKLLLEKGEEESPDDVETILVNTEIAVKMLVREVYSVKFYAAQLEYVKQREKNVFISNIHYRDTPVLVWATKTGNTDLVTYVLQKCLDVNQRFGGNRDSCLHLACEHENMEMVQCLIGHKANPNRLNESQLTPFLVAIQKGNFDIVSYLLKHGADVNCTRSENEFRRPLYMAMEFPKIFRLLVDSGANIHWKSPYGENIVHCLVSKHTLPSVVSSLEYVLSRGANVHLRDIYHSSPLNIACEEDNLPIIQCLVRYGADVTAEKGAPEYRNVLYIAYRSTGDEDILVYLCKQGADPRLSTSGLPVCLSLFSKNYKACACIQRLLAFKRTDTDSWIRILPVELFRAVHSFLIYKS